MAPSPLRLGNVYVKLEHQQSANYFLGQASLPKNLHIERSSMAPSPLRLGIVYGKLEHQQCANYFYC